MEEWKKKEKDDGKLCDLAVYGSLFTVRPGNKVTLTIDTKCIPRQELGHF